MDTYVILNSQVAFKDKIARLVQYSSRALWYLMQTKKMSPITIEKLKSLEYNFSTFRKLLRLGKSLEVLYGAFKTIHLLDEAVRVSLTLSKIATALFLFADHILWIGRSGLSTVDTTKWASISNKYWLSSIILNLVRDLHELNEIAFKYKISWSNIRGDWPLRDRVAQLGCCFYNEHKAVIWDTVKNGCDVWIPLTALGYTQLKPGTIGVLGTISSIAGLISMIVPYAKMTPS